MRFRLHGHTSRRSAYRPRLWVLHVFYLLVATVALGACGQSGATSAESSEPQTIRTPHPTFTPTPQELQPAPLPTQPEAVGGPGPATPQPAPAGASPPSGAKAVVNTPLVNARTGPGTEYDIVATVERGDEYDIIAKNADGSWWQVCCVADAPAWIIGEYVDTDGPVDAVPVAGAGAPVAAAPAPNPPAAPAAAAFDLVKQEQFPETGLVRVFLYIYAGNDALAGYSLRVTKDGTELPVEGSSFAGQPAFTWPFQDARQRYQNFKVEFSGVNPAGTWQLQPVDASGNVVGPPATFTLAENDPQQELYVRYVRR